MGRKRGLVKQFVTFQSVTIDILVMNRLGMVATDNLMYRLGGRGRGRSLNSSGRISYLQASDIYITLTHYTIQTFTSPVNSPLSCTQIHTMGS